MTRRAVLRWLSPAQSREFYNVYCVGVIETALQWNVYSLCVVQNGLLFCTCFSGTRAREYSTVLHLRCTFYYYYYSATSGAMYPRG